MAINFTISIYIVVFTLWLISLIKKVSSDAEVYGNESKVVLRTLSCFAVAYLVAGARNLGVYIFYKSGVTV
jgi:hypothetical protein